MILSLLKVGLLSLISISPLFAKADSSKVHLDLSAEKVNKKNAVGNIDYQPLYLANKLKFSDYNLSFNFSFDCDIKLDSRIDGEASYIYCDKVIFRAPGTFQIYLVSGNNEYLFYTSSSISASSTLYTCYIRGGLSNFQLLSGSDNITEHQAVNLFNRCFSSDYIDFQFDNQINYNALFNSTIKESYIATYSDMASYGMIPSTLFYSNGHFFDLVQTTYEFADGKTFLIDGGDSGYNYGYYTVPTAYPTAYFYVNSMRYKYDYIDRANSSGIYSKTVVVNQRNTNYYYDAVHGTTTEFIDNSSSWVNGEYSHLRIYDSSEIVFNMFKSLNTNDFVINYQYIQSNDVPYISNGGTDLVNPNPTTGYWLKDSFNVINTSLSGLAGFLNINILPGITIGTLVLIPFAVSMLFLAINLFKR